MKLSPKVYQAGADFGLFVGANKYDTGFYLKAHGAVGVMAVDPQLTEAGTLAAAAGYVAGAFKSNETVGATEVYDSIAEAFKGKEIGGNWKAIKIW